jgi:Ca-activated chloride channel family protein
MLSAQFIEHFHFLRPWWALALLPILLIIAIQWRREDQTRGWQSVIAPHLLDALRVRQFRNHWFNPASLSMVVMSLMIIILMGPSWRQQASPLTRDEAALVVLLDVSASMQQRDIQPSRLQRAQQKIGDLLELRKGSLTALVGYAGSAHTVLTLTDDQQIFQQYLSAMKPAVMPRPGKFPEYALPLLDRIAINESVPTTVLLVTDGVSDSSESAYEDYFSNHPHQLLVWGIGLESSAAEGMAPLEAKALRNLADAAGGSYIDLSIDKRDVNRIHRRVNSHYVVTEDTSVPWLDSGYWLVFPTLLLFSLWFRKGWTLQWMIPLVVVVGMGHTPTARADSSWFADLWLTPDQQGRLLFQQQRYSEAAQRFASPMWKGFAHYYAEEFKLAAEYFSRVDSEAARFNRANALAQRQDYLLAVRLYQQLLENNPEHAAAENNRQLVQALIDEINRMSESQADEPGGSNSSKELGDDEAQRADGAERKTYPLEELVQFSADELLQDKAINAMWLRSVQRDASQFLSIKFSMQLEKGKTSP